MGWWAQDWGRHVLPYLQDASPTAPSCGGSNQRFNNKGGTNLRIHHISNLFEIILPTFTVVAFTKHALLCRRKLTKKLSLLQLLQNAQSCRLGKSNNFELSTVESVVEHQKPTSHDSYPFKTNVQLPVLEHLKMLTLAGCLDLQIQIRAHCRWGSAAEDEWLNCRPKTNTARRIFWLFASFVLEWQKSYEILPNSWQSEKEQTFSKYDFKDKAVLRRTCLQYYNRWITSSMSL